MNERFEGQGKGKQEFRAGDYILEADFTPPKSEENSGRPTENGLEATIDTLPEEAQEAIRNLPEEPSDVGMEKVVDALPENMQEAIQGLSEASKKVVDEEVRFSELFSGIAQRGARVFAFITALFAVPGIVQAAGLTEYEQAKAARQEAHKARTGVDLAQRGVLQEEQRRQLEAQRFEDAVNQETLKEQQITSSGSWGKQFVIKAESDMGLIKNAEHANTLVQIHIGGFVREYHQPSPGKGVMERFDTHRIHRVFSAGDLEKLKTDALHLKGILDTLNTRYGVERYDTYLNYLNVILHDIELRSDYSVRAKEKAYQEINSRMIQNHGGQYGGPQHYGGQRYMRKFN